MAPPLRAHNIPRPCTIYEEQFQKHLPRACLKPTNYLNKQKELLSIRQKHKLHEKAGVDRFAIPQSKWQQVLEYALCFLEEQTNKPLVLCEST